jgi:hypothetical protein
MLGRANHGPCARSHRPKAVLNRPGVNLERLPVASPLPRRYTRRRPGG